MRIFNFLIYLYVILVPFVYLKDSKSVFSMPKLFIVRMITIVALAVIIVHFIKNGRIVFQKTQFTILSITYAGYLALSSLFSSQIYASLFGIQGRFVGIITYINFIFIAFLIVHFFPASKIRGLIKLSIAISFILALWGIFQHNGFLESENWSNDPKERAFATIEHGNHYGAYLVFHLMLLAGLIPSMKRHSSKALSVLMMPFFLLAILYTSSRGALLSLIASSILFFLLILRYRIHFKITIKKFVIGLSSVVILFTFSLFLISYSDFFKDKFFRIGIVQRTVDTITFIKSGNIPDRVSWFLSSIEMFKDNPIFGFGFSAYQDNYNMYRRLDYKNIHNSQDEITPENAHNEYVTKLVEEGSIGFVLYFFLIGYVLYVGLIAIRASNNNSTLVIGLFCAVLSYLLQVVLSFGTITTLTIFFIFLGVLMKLSIANQEEEIQNSKFKFQNSRQGAGGSFIVALGLSHKLIFTVISGSIITFLFIISINQMKAEIYFRQAENAFKEATFDKALYFGDNMVTTFPYEHAYFSTLGDYLYEISSTEQNSTDLEVYLLNAIKAYNSALSINSRLPHLQANIGLIYYSLADYYKTIGIIEKSAPYYEKSKEHYLNAVSFGPNNPVYPYNFAYLLARMGDYTKSAEYFEQVLRIRNPFRDTAYNLADAYINAGEKEKARYFLISEEKAGRGGPENNALLKKTF